MLKTKYLKYKQKYLNLVGSARIDELVKLEYKINSLSFDDKEELKLIFELLNIQLKNNKSTSVIELKCLDGLTIQIIKKENEEKQLEFKFSLEDLNFEIKQDDLKEIDDLIITLLNKQIENNKHNIIV